MRFKSGLIIGIFGLIVVFLGGIWFTLAIGILVYCALLELFRMAEFTGIKPATKTTIFLSITIILTAFLEVNGLIEKEVSNAILPISSIAICTWLLIQPKPGKISDIATSIFGLFYLGFLPSHWIKLRELDSIFSSSYYSGNGLYDLNNFSGFKITLITCLMIVASDIGSFYIGKKYGKRSLSIISPGKTIEGLIGGILSSIFTGIIFSLIFNWDYALFIGLIYGTLISLMALIGDLIESMMKRDANLKDSGDLLPGHGGMLDRIDSYIFTPSLIYYSILILDYFKII